MPGTWRADPEAVKTLLPLLELAKRVRHGTLDMDIWADAWAGPGDPGTPNGQVNLSTGILNLTGTAFEWTHTRRNG